MTKMRSTHPPLKPLERKHESPHCFFGLPPTDDNPTAFVDIKANFSTHEGEYIPFVWLGYRLQPTGQCDLSWSIDCFKSASLLSIMPRRLSILLLSEFY